MGKISAGPCCVGYRTEAWKITLLARLSSSQALNLNRLPALRVIGFPIAMDDSGPTACCSGLWALGRTVGE